MNINKIFQAKIFQAAIITIGILIVFLLVLKIGIFIGAQKANFSCRWSDNYHRNFAGPQQGFLGGFADNDFLESNGTFGQIIKIDSNNIIIRGREDMEKIISTSEKTVIKRFKDNIKLNDLQINDAVVIIGQPNNNGQIEAQLIRVMPQPPINNRQLPPPPQINPLPPTNFQPNTNPDLNINAK